MSTEEAQNSRLDRIEAKIDALSDAMVSLARAEEKLIAVEKNNFTHYERMNKLSEKIDSLERKVEDNARTISVINRMFWVVAMSAVGAVAANYFAV